MRKKGRHKRFSKVTLSVASYAAFGGSGSDLHRAEIAQDFDRRA